MYAAYENRIQHYAIENYKDAYAIIGNMAEAALNCSSKERDDRERNSARLLSGRFFKTANSNGQEVIKEVVGFGKTQLVTASRLASYERQQFKGPLLTDTKRKEVIADINEEIWLPVPYQFVVINSAFYFNLYQPPQSAPNAELVSNLMSHNAPNRPLPWDEFLHRWFPDCPHSRDILEAYIAKLVFDPLDRPRWAIIMRSDQGTGKNWLEDHLLSPLLGNTNVGSTSLSKVIGQFNGGQFYKKLLIINEVNDDRIKTYDRLKDIVSDSFKMVEEKYQPVRQQQLFLGVWIFTNHNYPIYIDADDRRFFVTPRIMHKESKEETKGFLMDTLKAFLDSEADSSSLGADFPLVPDKKLTGLAVIASWLKYISDTGYHGVDFGSVPQAGNRMSDLVVSDDGDAIALDLLAELAENEECYFQTSEIRKHRDFRYLNSGRIQEVLKEAGFTHKTQLWGRDGQHGPKRRAGWVIPGCGTKDIAARRWTSDTTC